MTAAADIRGAWRALRSDRWFAAATCLALALGIGAGAGLAGAGWSAFRPRLPFAHPNSLVRLYEEAPRAGIDNFGLPFLNYLAVRRVRRVFRGVALYIPPQGSLPLDLSAGAASGPVPGALVSSNFFHLLGVPPALGPGFPPRANPFTGIPGTGVVISHGLWARDFASDPRILGRPLRINGRTYSVAGVMPRGFGFPDGSRLWLSAASPAAVSAVANARASAFSEHIPRAVARLQPGLSATQAGRQLRAPLADLREMHFPGGPRVAIRAAPLAAAIFGPSRRPLAPLIAAATAVLLAAWLVAAILGWVRAARRTRELAVYAAIGGRAAAVRRVLWEQAILAGCASLAALLVAAWTARAAARALPAPAVGPHALAPGPQAWGAVALFAALSVLLPGAAVAWRLRRLDVARALQAGGPALTAARGQCRALSGFVAILAAAGFVLAAAAGTAVLAFRRAAGGPLGWQPRHAWFVSFAIHGSGVPAPPLGRQLARLARLAAELPGVRAAAVASSPPLGETGALSVVAAPGARVSIPRDGADLAELAVTPGYFRAMGIAVLAGRSFRPADFAPRAAPVAMVDAAVARAYWGSAANAVGQVLRTANGSFQNTRIIGIAATTRANYGYFQPNYPTAYVPAPGALAPATFTLVLRTWNAGAPPAAGLRRAFHAAGPGFAPAPAVAARRVLAREGRRYRTQSDVLALFAVLALSLLLVGTASVASFVTAARTREAGIRLALGASPGQVTGLILRQTVWPLLAGLAFGSAGALLFLAPVAGRLGYGVRSLPPASLALAAAAILTGALPAILRQRWRLHALEPAAVLRQE